MNKILENILFYALIFSIIVLSIAISIYAIKTSDIEKIIDHVVTGSEKSPNRKVSRMYLFFKRFFDIVFSACALMIFSPIMLWAYIVLKYCATTPVIKGYNIVGSKGKRVRFYRFRILEEPEDGFGDARVLNRKIYVTQLYKMPMCLSVLKGDMSIVGLERIQDTDGIDTDSLIEYQYFKPGIISLSDVLWERRISKLEFNNRYANSAGLKVDIAMLLYAVKMSLRDRSIWQ